MNKYKETSRQKLLPSFTKCGSIDVVDNLPPPPLLRMKSYIKNKECTHTSSKLLGCHIYCTDQNQQNKRITSPDKISYSNGANNLSRRRRKHNTAAVSNSGILNNVIEENREKNKQKGIKTDNVWLRIKEIITFPSDCLPFLQTCFLQQLAKTSYQKLFC